MLKVRLTDKDWASASDQFERYIKDAGWLEKLFNID
jgi:hypothetical protein